MARKITVKEEGVTISEGVRILNFIGAGATTSGNGSVTDIIITGGGGTLATQEEGVTQSTTVTILNVTGSGATISGAGTTATLNIPGGGGTLTTQDEGATQSTTVTTLNVTGAGATISGAGATATLNIPGGGGTLTTQEEGVTQSTTVTTLNVTGAGATISGAGATATLNIPGGGGITALTSDVTASGTGSVVATIANLAVTGAKIATNTIANSNLAQIATARIRGRTTAGTGDVEDLTATQATGLLNAFTSGSNNPGLKGLVPPPTLADITNFLRGDGTWAAGGSGITALTGDVTASGSGSVVATIANLVVTAAKIAANTITNSKLAQIATATFRGRSTAGTGDVEDLTTTQATALLNAFTSGSNNPGLKGLVPPPTLTDIAKFLRGDGTWATPAGGGGGGATVTARTTVTNTNYTILNTDHVIYVSNTTSNVILTLPTPVSNNQMYEIKDIGGNFGGTFSVTLRPAGADTVEGLAADFLLEAPYANFRVIANTAGTGWFIH